MESEIAEETDSEVIEEPSKPKSYRREIIIAVCSIFVAGLGTVILCLFTSLFTSTTGYVMTFWVSFLIGLGGAGVYLTLLLLVEGDLPFLRNSLITDEGPMSFLFLLSGGFVAAVTQVSAGILSAGAIQAVFLLGFGWLGALSGVAGVKTRTRITNRNEELEIINTKLEEQEVLSEGIEQNTLELENLVKELDAENIKLKDELSKLKKSKGGS